MIFAVLIGLAVWTAASVQLGRLLADRARARVVPTTIAVPPDVFQDALNTVDAYGYDGLTRTLLDLARASGHPLDDLEARDGAK